MSNSYVISGTAGDVSIWVQSNAVTLPPSKGMPAVQSGWSLRTNSLAVIANLSADVPTAGKSGRNEL